MTMKHKFKLKSQYLCVLGAVFLLSNPAQAARSEYVSGALSDGLYYKVGGGSVISSNFTHQRANTVGLGIRWNANLMCGNFDLNSTISNQLNGVTDGFNDVMGNLLSNATGAVASLPALIIQRANPQLYDLLTNGVLQGKLDFSDIKMSCKQMANKMADYADDAGLVQAAKAENWSNMLNTSVDAVRAEKTVENEAGENGLKWIGGTTVGGKDQHSISVTKDVAMAGYNLLQNRSVTDSSSVSNSTNKGNIYTTWNSPIDAEEWLIDVIGERSLSSSKNAIDSNTGKPGRGLNPKVQEYYEDYYNALVDLVNGTVAITDENLEKVSGGGVFVTRGLIEALQDDNDRAILANRLASEIALTRVIEEALMARRILLAGKKEPNVAKNVQAKTIINEQLAELDSELTQIKLEYEMRKMLTGNAATLIAERSENRQQGLMVPVGKDETKDIINSNR